MKEELTDIQANGKTLQEIFRYYWPNITDEAINIFVWEETCYPFSTKEMLHQIFTAYKNQRFAGFFDSN